jgi:heat shock protein HslJ
MGRRFFTVLLFVGLACFARSPSSFAAEPRSEPILQLSDSFWRVRTLRDSAEAAGATVMISVVDGANGTITFSTRSWLFAFPFTHDGTELKFHPAFAWVDSNNQHSKVKASILGALMATSGYQIHNGILTFANKLEQPNIVLTPVPQQGVEDRRWRIAEYRGARSNSTEALGDTNQPADITFMNGRIDGGAGCGAWTGSYSLHGNRLSVKAGTILAGLCSFSQFEESGWLKKDLNGEMTIEMSASNMLLRDQSGNPLILLAPM